MAFYAAQIYRQLSFYGNIRIEARIRDVDGAMADLTPEHARQRLRGGNQIGVRALQADHTVPSALLMKDPIAAVTPLLTDLFYPAHCPIDIILKATLGGLNLNALNGRPLLVKGQWTDDWKKQ